MAKRGISNLFLSDSTEAVSVEIAELTDGNKFQLMPVRQRDRERWQREHHMCPVCGGLGFFPGEKRLLVCHRCKGGIGLPSFADPAIRFAVLREVVQGWSGWLTVEGQEIEYSEANLRRVADDYDLYNILMNAASALVKKVEENEGEA